MKNQEASGELLLQEAPEPIPYEKLTFASDFLFCKIMESRPDLCKELVELLLARPVREVRNIRSQFSAKDTIGGKGVRFDVIFYDEENVVYDMEMQTRPWSNLPKRSRYYQAMIDSGSLEQGQDYEELRKSFVIFICTFDPFGKGRHIYTFENRCIEEPELPLADDTRKVFLSTVGEMNDVSEEILEFLDYVAGRPARGDIAEALEAEVWKAKQKEEWRRQYMQNNAVIMDAKREGKAEGRAQGLNEGKKLMVSVIQRLKNGETPEALFQSGVDEETVNLALTLRDQ